MIRAWLALMRRKARGKRFGRAVARVNAMIIELFPTNQRRPVPAAPVKNGSRGAS